MEQLHPMNANSSGSAAAAHGFTGAPRIEVRPAATATDRDQRPALVEKVVIRNLSFFYKDYEAVRNINVSLYDKQVTAFIGPSGCGKSTLLRTFNRIYDLYPGQRATGELLIDGKNILEPKQDLNLLRAKVGMGF